MGKTVKKKKKQSAGKIILLVALLLLLAVELALFVIPQTLYRLQAEPETLEEEILEIPEAETEESLWENEEAPEAAEETAAEETADVEYVATAFPLMLEDGKLEIESLFQFDGINPDCGNQEQDEIATLMVKNTSDIFLTEANIQLETNDGIRIRFVVTNLPAGKSAMVFSSENISIGTDVICTNVSCQALWGETIVPMPEEIDVSVDGITVTLTNQTGQDIPELTVYCHSLIGEEFFGGITYAYKVENLSANDTVVIETLECIMGLAEVVRIAMN